MKHFKVSLFMACMVLAGTACNESSTNDTEDPVSECTASVDWQKCLSETAYSQCKDGVVSQGVCLTNEVCQNGECIRQQPQPQGCSPDGVKCEGNVLVTCASGVESRQQCERGCVDNACVQDVPQPQPQGCSPDGAKCEGNELVTCASGVESRQPCALGCVDNACVQDVPQPQGCSPDGVKCEGNELVTCASGVESRQPCAEGCKNNACIAKCGNGVREGNEVCDGEDLGTMTCRDLPNVMQTAVYNGSPACNETCDGIENGTCEKGFCGNNILDINEQEICDIVDGESKFLNTVTCSDIKGFAGKIWQEGGKPECPADCSSNFKMGTCKLAAQPQGGIETCHFDEFKNDEANKEVSGHVVIHTIEGVTTELVSGQFVCGNPKSATHTWKGEKARFQECEDCDANEFRMVSEVSYGTYYPGTYGCVFQVSINTVSIDGDKSTSFYNCPVTPGYPYAQSIPDDSIMHTFEVAGEAVEGTVLAHWDFGSYKKDDRVDKVSADDGVMKSSSQVSLSDGSTIRMLTGTGLYPEAAVSSDKWSDNATLDLNAKHFVIQSSATGYKNIRFQFMVAGSGIGKKQIVTAYKAGEGAEIVGKELTFDDSNKFHPFELTNLEKASNQSRFELDVYTYAASEENMTIRLDDIYILGDPME